MDEILTNFLSDEEEERLADIPGKKTKYKKGIIGFKTGVYIVRLILEV